MIIAALVGSLATLALHNSKYGWKGNKSVAHDPNVNMDIGQTLQVQDWQDQGNGKYIVRARCIVARCGMSITAFHRLSGDLCD
jgi:hypothetical protein